MNQNTKPKVTVPAVVNKKAPQKKPNLPPVPKTQYSVSSGGLTRGCQPIKDNRQKAKKVPQEPTVYYTPEVHQKMHHIVAKCPKEVGWMGLVKKVTDTSYLIYEIFVPKQEVTSVETEIESDAMAELAMELMEAGHDTSEMYAWYHSHVNMGVSPSGQDESQVEEFLDSCPVFIRGIINKRGDSKVDVYYPEHGICYTNVPTEVHLPPLNTEVATALNATLDANITEVVYQYPNYQTNYQSLYKPKNNGRVHNTTPPANSSTLDDELDADDIERFAQLDNSVVPLFESATPGDTGYGVTWTVETPANLRPEGWSLDPYYMEERGQWGAH
jgi:proteasome lid subunit RPN8/RPN11